MKRLLSFILAVFMIVSCVLFTDFVSVDTAAVVVETVETSANQGPQSNVQGAVILHCFNWSYNSIKNNLQAIKDAGYTAVQTSPVQTPKDYNGGWNDQKGQWWKLYQPLDFKISNNTWLGTKNDLKALCDTAESMGIKVIVDVVANHVSGNGGGGYWNLDQNVDGQLKRNEYYHDNGNGATDNNRWEMTQGHIGMPDLNTAHPDVQRIIKGFLEECISIGVDGFRFDAAKHIELPTDSGCGSQFWPTVLSASNGKNIYYYGEILNGCGTDIGNYTKYMSITDNYSSDAILMAACHGNANGMANSYYAKGAAANKNVLWVESHDTHMGESGTGGMSNTSGVSDDKIIKAWAMVGSRADATALYFARPAGNMGAASTNTTYKSKPVAEVNKFKNYFAGQSEYLSSEGSIAYNERGTAGVVLVNAGGTSCSVNVRANKMANGTYTDQITGNKFTVSNGRITGNIGNSGVAVVYNPSNTPSPTPTPEPTVKPTPEPTPQPTESPVKYLVGDIDGDNNVSVIDATAIQRHASKTKLLTGKALMAADVDLNGDISVIDATCIQMYLIGKKINGSYCGEYKNDGPVVDPTDEPVVIDGEYIYFKNNDNWSQVNIYYWSDSNNQMMAWPGVQMQSAGNNVYKYEYPKDATMVIFNNGQGTQTGDLNIGQVNYIYDNGSWSPYKGNNNNNDYIDPAPMPDGNYVYFKNNDNWGEVKIYYWSDSNNQMTSWPGESMQSVGNNVYKFELPEGATKIVFNNNNQGSQTGDLNFEGANKIYDNGWKDYNG